MSEKRVELAHDGGMRSSRDDRVRAASWRSTTGAGEHGQLRPTEPSSSALAACAAMDVASLLDKKRQASTRYRVEVAGRSSATNTRRSSRGSTSSTRSRAGASEARQSGAASSSRRRSTARSARCSPPARPRSIIATAIRCAGAEPRRGRGRGARHRAVSAGRRPRRLRVSRSRHAGRPRPAGARRHAARPEPRHDLRAPTSAGSTGGSRGSSRSGRAAAASPATASANSQPTPAAPTAKARSERIKRDAAEGLGEPGRILVFRSRRRAVGAPRTSRRQIAP